MTESADRGRGGATQAGNAVGSTENQGNTYQRAFLQGRRRFKCQGEGVRAREGGNCRGRERGKDRAILRDPEQPAG